MRCVHVVNHLVFLRQSKVHWGADVGKPRLWARATQAAVVNVRFDNVLHLDICPLLPNTRRQLTCGSSRE